MGGFVVTNAIRALSDLFARDALRPRLNAGTVDEHTGGTLAPVSPNIGNALTLMRFVLASPDISAEALLSNRANYLAASLRRFREAYLFSNEGDEVLRQISTTTNYFSFPTKTWRHGYRLGSDAMVELVRRIAARVKARQPGFLVISQNGDALLPDEKFRDAIDAFAREDLFLGEDEDGEPNDPASIKESIARLKLFAAGQKPVLVVEYPG